MEFIFMLTHEDQTVPNALEVYDTLKDVDLRYVGFKDVGLPVAALRELSDRIHADGRTVMLEVVSEQVEDEVRSVEAGLAIGADWIVGGTNAERVAPLLAGSEVRYCPFPGRVLDHPSKLRGTIEEIVESARSLAAMPEVGGLDLLAYRYDGDVLALVEQVVAAVDVPVIAAGSIERAEQIAALDARGVWGFTIGGAIFDGKLPAPDTSVAAQCDYVCDLLTT